MKTKAYLSLLLFLLLASCEENKVDEPQNNDNKEVFDQIRNFIISGKIDTSNTYYIDLQPDIVLPNTETGCHTYDAEVSLDVNNDSTNDLSFIYHLSNDIMGECCTGGGCFGSLYFFRTIKSDKNVQFHADSNNVAIPTILGDTIDSKLNWNNNNEIILFMTSSPSGDGWGSLKWWNDEDLYYGMRIIQNTDTIYGWILINSKETITIKEFALNNK